MRVDLPMPGSPPISVTDPGTRPPPSTRSNSAEPVDKRGDSRTASTANELDVSTRFAAETAALRGLVLTVSATNVFHSPHVAH
jgi:hypothetical protein